MIELSVLTAIIIGLSQVAKIAGFPVKFIPILNIGIGVIISVVYHYNDIKSGVINGIVAGLSASGLYSGTKNVIQGITKNGGSHE